MNLHRWPHLFSEGDRVLIKVRPERLPPGVSSKLHDKCMGPYTILHKVGDNAYVLNLPEEVTIHSTFNIDDLLPFHPPLTVDKPSLPSSFASSADIEHILDNQLVLSPDRITRRFLVRWSGDCVLDDA